MLTADGHVKLDEIGKPPGAEWSGRKFGGSIGVSTPEYMAPELIRKAGETKASPGFEIDWWSYGILLYELVVGLPPFYSTNISQMYNMILTKELEFPERLMSAELQALISLLLTRNPAERLGHDGSNEIKDHPWYMTTYKAVRESGDSGSSASGHDAEEFWKRVKQHEIEPSFIMPETAKEFMSTVEDSYVRPLTGEHSDFDLFNLL